jgi:hypothetical protein
MALKKVLLYLVLAALAFVVVGTVLSIVTALLGFVWALVSGLVTLAVTGALVYGAYRLYSWASEDSPTAGRSSTGSEFDLGSTFDSDTSPTDADSGVDRIREQYADGRISEAELERKLERELDDGDGIDRELDRSKN